jgi:hypothetical protein
MRLSLITLLAYLVCYVSCFGEHGAYERALFWNMYELDAALHDRPQLIAPRCTRGMPNRVMKCTLQEFLNFFDRSEMPTPITEDVSRKTVDELAQILQNHGYKGSYEANQIFVGLGRTTGNMGTVFTEVQLSRYIFPLAVKCPVKLMHDTGFKENERLEERSKGFSGPFG